MNQTGTKSILINSFFSKTNARIFSALIRRQKKKIKDKNIPPGPEKQFFF